MNTVTYDNYLDYNELQDKEKYKRGHLTSMPSPKALSSIKSYDQADSSLKHKRRPASSILKSYV